jgi:hypothetical protein
MKPVRCCAACGEVFQPGWPDCRRYSDGLSRTEIREIEKFRQTHCVECAAELSLKKVGPPGTTIHGTGGGTRVIRDPKGLS